MSNAAARIEPGQTIGILGGGQLARMLALAAARLGLRAHIFAPETDSPAFDVSAGRTIAKYDDKPALEAFSKRVSVVTYEFENVPTETAAFLGERCPVRPDAGALAASQDRLVEKEFINNLGIATAAYARVDDAGALARAVAVLGRPCILKARRFGYDGKGQVLVREGSDLAVSFRSVGGSPAIVEGVVLFTREVSVIAARGLDGTFRAFDVCENLHEKHILSFTRVPSRVKPATAELAVAITQKIADALNYVGIITVEMFVTETGPANARQEGLIVNEIAPRVHNSGHWTIDGAATSQFEQHIRAICGWPLGATRRHGPIEMQNIIGTDVHRWRDFLGEPGASLHLYGKTAVRPGRKMGHVTRVLPDPKQP